MTQQRTLDLAHLVRAHQVGVWRYLRFLGANTAEAEDLTQETFLAVWSSSFEEHDHAATKGYLRTVARNLWLKRLRKQRREPELVDLEESDADWQRFAREDDGECWITALRHCLLEATPRVRLAFDRFYADGCSREQLGKELGMSEEGTKTLLRRAREALRECIERRVEKETLR
jgi:RNA polymerase sigma-70 factor (ECF subfamily)